MLLALRAVQQARYEACAVSLVSSIEGNSGRNFKNSGEIYLNLPTEARLRSLALASCSFAKPSHNSFLESS